MRFHEIKAGLIAVQCFVIYLNDLSRVYAQSLFSSSPKCTRTTMQMVMKKRINHLFFFTPVN